MVYADLEYAFGPHRDTGYHKSSDDCIALHFNAWEFNDYVYGANES